MKIRVVVLLVSLLACALAARSYAGDEFDKDLTKKIADIIKECDQVKPGTTRAALLKIFTTEGGLSNAKRRTFVHRRCPYIKVDVEFALSKQKQNVLDEQPTDTVAKISKPYLDWSVWD